MASAFAVWITGLPASDKSTVARALARELGRRGVDAALLESDALRPILTPHAASTDDDRDAFYLAFAYIGQLLVSHGIPVIFDATGNRAHDRAHARTAIPRFIEIHVDAPIDLCAARESKSSCSQREYELPDRPALVVTERDTPEAAASTIAALLERRGWLVAHRKRARMSMTVFDLL